MKTDSNRAETLGTGDHFLNSMITDLHEELSEKVIGAVFEVANTLGAGFLEKVYESALVKELGLRGLRAQAQTPVSVSYKGECVGNYFADVVVEEELIVELKCVEQPGGEHMAQCLNYLRASGRDVCLLVNFQNPRVEWKRIAVHRVHFTSPRHPFRSLAIANFKRKNFKTNRTHNPLKINTHPSSTRPHNPPSTLRPARTSNQCEPIWPINRRRTCARKALS